MFSCWAALEEEKAIMGGTTYFGRVRDLFVVPRIRRATLGAFTVMIAQQMCTSFFFLTGMRRTSTDAPPSL